MIGLKDTKYQMGNLKISLLLTESSRTGYSVQHFSLGLGLTSDYTSDSIFLAILNPSQYIHDYIFSLETYSWGCLILYFFCILQDFAIETVKSTHEFWKALISKMTNAGELNW